MRLGKITPFTNLLLVVLASVCVVMLAVGCSGSGSTSSSTGNDALKVISPAGGECLETGAYFTFRWNKDAVTPSCGTSGLCGPTFVRIEFIDGPSVTANTLNTGKYKWRVPSYYCDIYPCGTYYVEIYNSSEIRFPDESAESEGPVTITKSCN